MKSNEYKITVLTMGENGVDANNPLIKAFINTRQEVFVGAYGKSSRYYNTKLVSTDINKGTVFFVAQNEKDEVVGGGRLLIRTNKQEAIPVESYVDISPNSKINFVAEPSSLFVTKECREKGVSQIISKARMDHLNNNCNGYVLVSEATEANCKGTRSAFSNARQSHEFSTKINSPVGELTIFAASDINPDVISIKDLVRPKTPNINVDKAKAESSSGKNKDLDKNSL